MSVWFMTGASRGFGAEITRQALAAGHQVVASARHAHAVDVSDARAANVSAVNLDIADQDRVDNVDEG